MARTVMEGSDETPSNDEPSSPENTNPRTKEAPNPIEAKGIGADDTDNRSQDSVPACLPIAGLTTPHHAYENRADRGAGNQPNNETGIEGGNSLTTADVEAFIDEILKAPDEHATLLRTAHRREQLY